MGFLEGAINTAGGLWTNKANQDFAEEMAGSQYQRAVADMKAAGLNPNAVFGSGGGSPSSSPGGQATNPMDTGGGLGSSAKNVIEMRQGLAQTEQTTQNTEVAKAAADFQRANAKIAHSNADVIEKENSAYKKVLGESGGQLAAANKKYGGGGWVGKLAGDIGLTTGAAAGSFGGASSAKSLGAFAQEKLGATNPGAGPNFPRQKYGGKR